MIDPAQRIAEKKEKYRIYGSRTLGNRPERNYMQPLHEYKYPNIAEIPFPATDVVQITLFGDPVNDLNPNHAPGYGGPTNKSVKNLIFRWQRLRKHWKEEAAKSWIAYGKPKFDEKIQICFHICRVRAVDPDNALAACKNVVDGMCRQADLGERGLVPDDSSRWIRYAPVQFSSGKMHTNMPYVLMVICPTRLADEIIRQNLNKQKEIADAISRK